MINYNNYTTQTTGEAWAMINEESIYPARLMMIRISKQSEKFVEEGQTPKDQISFVFDVLNENNESVHVATKPCTISFTDKSRLPKIWEKAFELTNGSDMTKNFYDGDDLKDIYCKVYVSVTHKEDKTFNEVTKVVSLSKPTDQDVSKVTEFDMKVYGQPCEQYDLAKSYNN